MKIKIIHSSGAFSVMNMWIDSEERLHAEIEGNGQGPNIYPYKNYLHLIKTIKSEGYRAFWINE